MKEKTFTQDEINKAVKSALDNWDFDVLDDGEKQRLVLEKYPPVGPITVGRGFSDIWDWLAEYASATAADL